MAAIAAPPWAAGDYGCHRSGRTYEYGNHMMLNWKHVQYDIV